MKRPKDKRWLLPPLVSLLIAGIWAERQLWHLPVGDPGAYHANVRSVAQNLPYRIGDWVGSDVDTPPAAMSLLKPNVLLSRRFRNLATGEHATLMIVQCQDARDMGGHYPPVCYPANGWTLRETQQRDLPSEQSTLPGTVYRFTIEKIDRYSEILIYSFFVRPDGVIESGREGVREAAADPRSRIFGAGQVQVVFGASMAQTRRDEVFRTLISEAFPIVDAIRGGVVQ